VKGIKIRSTNSVVALFVSISIILSSSVLATPVLDPFCSRNYAALIGRGGFSELPSVIDYPLPADFLAILAKHPISKLKAKWKDGEGLEFVISHFQNLPKMDSRQGMNVGETIQSHFVAKVLTELFPKAKISGALSEKSPSKKIKKRIQIEVRDPSEFGVVDTQDKDSVKRILPMSILKAANPGIGGISHGALRTQLGIPEQAMTASLYLRYPVVNGSDGSPNVVKLLDTIEAVKEPDIVFVSRGGAGFNSGTEGELAEARKLIKNFLPEYKVSLLSDWTNETYKPGEKRIVLNDMLGKLPSIYNVSDLSVVVGPINIFEPLTSGSKTVFFTHPDAIRGYSGDEFKRMGDTALKSGGALAVRGLDDLYEKLPDLLSPKTPILAPYRLPGESGSTPAQVFLDRLESLVRASF